jgi:hypothetical protein
MVGREQSSILGDDQNHRPMFSSVVRTASKAPMENALSLVHGISITD